MKPQILIPLMAGLALLCACKGKTAYELSGSSTADTVAIASDSTSVKLVKTARMRFKVKSVQTTNDQISALTVAVKGMIIHHETNSLPQVGKDIKISEDSILRVTALNTEADVTVKVPSEKLEDFMNGVARLSIYINNRKMDISDKSLEYLSAKLKLQTRREFINQQKKGKITIKHPENALALKDEMVDEQIDNQHIDNDVKNSIVSLSFYETNKISKEIIANDDPSAYDLPFFKRLVMAVANGWILLGSLIIGLVNMWAILLAATGLWMFTKNIWKKRQPDLVKN